MKIERLLKLALAIVLLSGSSGAALAAGGSSVLTDPGAMEGKHFHPKTESTYDWEDEEWTVPLNLLATQVLKVGTQPISLQLGGRYYADTTRRPRLGDSRRHHLAVSEMRARCGRATRARGPVRRAAACRRKLP